MSDQPARLTLRCESCHLRIAEWRWPDWLPTAGVMLGAIREHRCEPCPFTLAGHDDLRCTLPLNHHGQHETAANGVYYHWGSLGVRIDVEPR